VFLPLLLPLVNRVELSYGLLIKTHLWDLDIMRASESGPWGLDKCGLIRASIDSWQLESLLLAVEDLCLLQ
jgi:hypothetical protein